MTEAFSTIPAGYQPAESLLAGRVVLVTGAGQGLGRIAALSAARHGASVVLHGRNMAKLEAVYDEIEAAGDPQPAILPLDFLIASQADLDGFAQTIHDTFRRLDGIFHAATHFSPLMALALQDLETWQKHLRVNLSVPAALTRACLPMLQRAPDAAVVFLSETHAITPTAFWGAFATSKNALAALVETWNAEMTAHPGLRFRLCVPGPVDSPMRSKSHPAESSASLPSAQSLARHFLYLLGPDARSERNPFHRCFSPDGDSIAPPAAP